MVLSTFAFICICSSLWSSSFWKRKVLNDKALRKIVKWKRLKTSHKTSKSHSDLPQNKNWKWFIQQTFSFWLPQVLMVTSAGDFDIELWSREAPKACRNFVQLCMEGYYNGSIFHRVIPGFIVQGGDPTGTGEGGESIYGKPFRVRARLGCDFASCLDVWFWFGPTVYTQSLWYGRIFISLW